jgi:polysaccharide export outer membrane protein
MLRSVRTRPWLLPLSWCACALCALLLTACSSLGEYLWYTDVPPPPPASELTVQTGDTVSVRVLGHEEMSVKEKVRADGRIAIPLIGEIDVLGKRPAALRAEIEARLKDFIVSPSVMLNVEDVQPLAVAVLGEVGKPGMYVLEPAAGLAQALAASGGLTDFAHRDRIFVVRQRPASVRIRFTYEAVSRNEGRAGSFPLRPGDVVVVE